MRHAYLILAHNEFDLLRKLVTVIDDKRNDIFIHFDRKVKVLPNIDTKYSNLYFIANRVDVRWGDVSVVEAECLLFEKAYYTSVYDYYHLLSGVDLPLKCQDDIHSFFSEHKGKQFIGFNQETDSNVLDRKVNRYHLFAKDFKYDGRVISLMKRLLRASYLRIQLLFNMSRNQSVQFKKGTQWISITHDFVGLVLSQKDDVLRVYSNTFCADELFIQTICWNSDYRGSVYDLNNENIGSQRMIGWNNNVITDWKEDDYEKLIQSNLLFARKFSSAHLEVVNKIIEHISPLSTDKNGI